MQFLLIPAAWLRRHPFWAYLIALLNFGLALFLRFEVDPILPPGFPYLTFFPAVIISCFLAGLGPGILVAVTSGFSAWYFFIAPAASFALTPQSILALGFYVAIVGIDIALIEIMYRSLTRLAEERARSARLAAQHEVLFKELQHRVSNNLQLTGALLTLQAERVKDADARDALAVASHRLALLGQIHRRLRDPGGIGSGLEDFLRDLCRDLIDSAGAGHVHCQVQAVEVPVGPDQAIPLALIVAELVSNALEHAFADGRSGRITLICRRDGPMLILEVRDDGRGLPPGFDLDRIDSLGLQIARSLADQLNGRLDFARAEVGTTARISLPVKVLSAGEAD